MLTSQQLQDKYLGSTTDEGSKKEIFGIYKPDQPYQALARIQQAHSVVVQAWVDIDKSIRTISRNHAATAGERTKMIAKVAEKRRDDALAAVAAARQVAEGERQTVAAQIDRTIRPTSPAQIALLPEVRNHLARLSEAERYDLLASARGDDMVALWEAVAGAPAFLSGVVEKKRRDCRDNLLGLRDPKLLELEAGYAHGLALLDKASGRLVELVDDHVDFDTAAELRSLEL